MRFTIDGKPLTRAAAQLAYAEKKALPDALKEALTVVAYRARKAERKNAQEVLDRPKPFTISSFAARRAEKVSGDYESAVFVLPRMQDILQRLEEGGSEDSGLQIKDRRLENRYGSLPKRYWPARLLSNEKRYFEGTINGAHGIWERLKGPGKKRDSKGRFRKNHSNRVKLMVLYVDSPDWAPMLGFEAVARKAGGTFRDEANRQIDKRLRRAGFSR